MLFPEQKNAARYCYAQIHSVDFCAPLARYFFAHLPHIVQSSDEINTIKCKIGLRKTSEMLS